MTEKISKKWFAAGILALSVLIVFFTTGLSWLARVCALVLIGGFSYKMIQSELPTPEVINVPQPEVEDGTEDSKVDEVNQ